MNSPSSSATTLHPMRMWRPSESDLYCSAMKIFRSPELMQLLSVKSMMRYGPPKYTAGLARSLVSGYKRSPAPPARTMTTTSSCMRAPQGFCNDGRRTGWTKNRSVGAVKRLMIADLAMVLTFCAV